MVGSCGGNLGYSSEGGAALLGKSREGKKILLGGCHGVVGRHKVRLLLLCLPIMEALQAKLSIHVSYGQNG